MIPLAAGDRAYETLYLLASKAPEPRGLVLDAGRIGIDLASDSARQPTSARRGVRIGKTRPT